MYDIGGDQSHCRRRGRFIFTEGRDLEQLDLVPLGKDEQLQWPDFQRLQVPFIPSRDFCQSDKAD